MQSRQPGDPAFDHGTRIGLPLLDGLGEGLAARADFRVRLPQPLLAMPAVDEVLEPGWRDGDGHRLGAQALMLPEAWEKEQWQNEAAALDLSVLHWPFVYGGRVTERAGRTHASGQALLTHEGGLIDDSFGMMDGNESWSADILEQDGPHWRYIGPREGAERLDGEYLFLGSVHRHFGHVMLEGLSRTWALRQVQAIAPDIRFLVYEPELLPFARSLLALAGVPAHRIVHAPPMATMERLYVPRPAMRTHRWISAGMRDVWEGMAVQRAGDARGKVYLSRRGVGNRPVVGEADVEALFRGCGFEIVRPEDLDVSEQIALAARTGLLAGPVGSQMYLAAFQPRGAKVLVIAPRNFFLRDDLLVAAAKSHRLAVCFGSPIDFQLAKLTREWTVDIEAVRRRLEFLENESMD